MLLPSDKAVVITTTAAMTAIICSFGTNYVGQFKSSPRDCQCIHNFLKKDQPKWKFEPRTHTICRLSYKPLVWPPKRPNRLIKWNDHTRKTPNNNITLRATDKTSFVSRECSKQNRTNVFIYIFIYTKSLVFVVVAFCLYTANDRKSKQPDKTCITPVERYAHKHDMNDFCVPLAPINNTPRTIGGCYI